MQKEEDGKHNKFLYVLLVGILISIIASFYFFYFKKDYDFIVETSCNPEKDTCFYRDCTNPDDCPPNNLSYYTEYYVNASDFKYCENEDCAYACLNGIIDCAKTECSDSDIEEGICVAPTNPNTQN